MEHVTATDLQRKLGEVMSKAKREAVLITSRGREELVICDADEYKRLKLLEGIMDKDAKAQINKILSDHSDTFTELANR